MIIVTYVCIAEARGQSIHARADSDKAVPAGFSRPVLSHEAETLSFGPLGSELDPLHVILKQGPRQEVDSPSVQLMKGRNVKSQAGLWMAFMVHNGEKIISLLQFRGLVVFPPYDR